MAQYKSKFTDIDPEVCSMGELEAEIKRLEGLSGYFETKQLALKTFINSVYGASASKYFVGHNTDVAESITMQGQDLNHFSENSVNKYYQGIFQSDAEYYRTIYVPVLEYVEKYDLPADAVLVAKNENKVWERVALPCTPADMKNEDMPKELKAQLKKISVQTQFGPYLGITIEQARNIDIDKGRVTPQKKLEGDVFKYLEGDVSMTVAGDTDSVAADTLVYYNNDKVTIAELFTTLKYLNNDCVLRIENGSEIVPVQADNVVKTKAYNEKAPFCPVDRPIKYIMRHKVSKAKYRIKSADGKEVIVTDDHSCMVMRAGKLIEVKAHEINPETDELIVND